MSILHSMNPFHKRLLQLMFEVLAQCLHNIVCYGVVWSELWIIWLKTLLLLLALLLPMLKRKTQTSSAAADWWLRNRRCHPLNKFNTYLCTHIQPAGDGDGNGDQKWERHTWNAIQAASIRMHVCTKKVRTKQMQFPSKGLYFIMWINEQFCSFFDFITWALEMCVRLCECSRAIHTITICIIYQLKRSTTHV